MHALFPPPECPCWLRRVSRQIAARLASWQTSLHLRQPLLAGFAQQGLRFHLPFVSSLWYMGFCGAVVRWSFGYSMVLQREGWIRSIFRDSQDVGSSGGRWWLLGRCCAFSAIIIAVMAWRRLLDLTRRMIDDVPILTKKTHCVSNFASGAGAAGLAGVIQSLSQHCSRFYIPWFPWHISPSFPMPRLSWIQQHLLPTKSSLALHHSIGFATHAFCCWSRRSRWGRRKVVPRSQERHRTLTNGD
jgi:hypothetical protein